MNCKNITVSKISQIGGQIFYDSNLYEIPRIGISLRHKVDERLGERRPIGKNGLMNRFL